MIKFLRRFAPLLCATVLASCGGGLDVAINGGGVGTGGTGIVAGTVTGLGSVIVDGVRYDDSRAVIETRPDLVASQPLALADVQVGQYAWLDLDAAGTPTRVRIESQLIGPAASVNVGSGQFTVWGQPVLVNTDPSRGPVTVLAGYASLADLHANDPVQVYGVMQAGDSGNDLIRATRIERLAAATTLARVTGTLQASGGSWRVAGHALDLSGVAPAPSLASGTAVSVAFPWNTMMSGAWAAHSIVTLAHSTGGPVNVSGVAHVLGNGDVEVQGVEFSLANLSASVRDALGEGRYVTVNGTTTDQDGHGIAAGASALPTSGRAAQVRGSITAVSGTSTFIVRGQTIDASHAQFGGGSLSTIAVGRYVEVTGTQAPTAILAASVTFDSAPPDGAVVDVTGTVQSVDVANSQMKVLTSDGEVVTMVLPPNTPLPTSGQSLRLSGYWNGEQVQVRDMEK
jgi:hypothetical protein